MHLKHKFWLFAFLVMFAGCASMEQAKSFNEQAAYADSTLDGIVTSLSSQYQAGVITKAEKRLAYGPNSSLSLTTYNSPDS